MEKRKANYLILFFALFVFLGACAKEEKQEVYEPESDPEASQISTYNNELLEEQEELEAELLAEYKEKNYTLEDPFIKVDPYDAAPLSALVMFETEEPSEIQLTIGTKKYEEPIVKKYEEAEEVHEIPVLGLYPDTENEVKIKATNTKGETEEATITISTDPLPEDFMETELVTSHANSMANGLTFMVPTRGHLYAIDVNADVRWYSSLENRIVFTMLKNGNYLQTAYEDSTSAYSILMERDLLGKLYNAYDLDIDGFENNNIIHHDVIEMASGNLLATTHEPDSEYIEDHMHEIDRETGETNQEINLREVMPEEAATEYDGKGAENNDWIHQNAIWSDDGGKSILVSGRSQDVILKLDYPTGDLQWILGADEHWPEDFDDYLLEPEGEVDFPAGQHAMKIVDNPEIADEPHLKDVILFDNNAVITRGDEEASEEYSQAIRYRVDEEEMTVEQTWDYGKDRGEDFYSSIIGNVQYLNDRDNLILNSGAVKNDEYATGRMSKVVEVDALDDDSGEIFEVDAYGKGDHEGKLIYRAWRYPLYQENWSYQLSEEGK